MGRTFFGLQRKCASDNIEIKFRERTMKANRLRLVAVFALAICGPFAASAQTGSKDEIRIGQTLPYSGPVSGFAAIGRVQEAFFAKVNAEGGIHGRKIRLISRDDAYSPPKTVEQTRELVEKDEVLLMFNSLGTATNGAVHRYLNDRKVPQLFVVSGAAKFADPKNFPWTIPGVLGNATEGSAYARHILQTRPDAKIAILSQNDDFGRDYLAGFKRALGNKAAAMIVAEMTYENSDPTINSQLAALKASGANTLLSVTLGKFTAQMIRGISDIGWKPEVTYIPQGSSSITFLEPAGLENAVGLVSNVSQKDINDDQWSNDEEVKEYFAFMRQFLPSADPHNALYALGYMNGHLLVEVLKACGDDLSRENVMRQATSLHGLKLPLLLPGVSISTAPDDYLPIKQLQLRRFNGKNWIGIDRLMESE
jgi:branched-chain amino acid transport system substrate-binding protein